ncbi:hypothetical protein AGMMS50268_38750 [Spirochaetia bacterium]|nr:hypothetical protein AGMMS50268_38750 [Spirochaetia bacterium]
MKKAIFTLVLVLMVGMILGSCATYATKSGTPQDTIPILAMVRTLDQPEGTPIASYVTVFGISIGYDDFIESVKGQNYDILIRTYFLGVTEIIAVTK